MVDKESVIILVALEQELPKTSLPGWRIVYTGVGKINAAMTTANVIGEFGAVSIINFGTAGALREDLKGLYEVTVFKQRDMDATSLGFALGETPYDEIKTISLNEKGLSCGSGDSFVDSMPDLNTDLVDMEAYAIAKVCKVMNTSFSCFKYISDNANENAVDDWTANFKSGAQAFAKMIQAEG